MGRQPFVTRYAIRSAAVVMRDRPPGADSPRLVNRGATAVQRQAFVLCGGFEILLKNDKTRLDCIDIRYAASMFGGGSP